MSDDLIRYRFEDIKPSPERARAWAAVQRFNDNATPPEERRALIQQLFVCADDSANVTAPLNYGGGHPVKLGRKVFINAGLTLGAAAPVEIGDYTLIGPHVQIHTATHPVDPMERQRWAFWGQPVRIGQNVWIGAGAIICPGVSIGDHSVVAAGSVVVADVPACTLVGGNPARFIRQLDAPDMDTLYALREDPPAAV